MENSQLNFADYTLMLTSSKEIHYWLTIELIYSLQPGLVGWFIIGLLPGNKNMKLCASVSSIIWSDPSRQVDRRLTVTTIILLFALLKMNAILCLILSAFFPFSFSVTPKATLYSSSGCSGQWLEFSRGSYEPSLSAYGFDDQAYSVFLVGPYVITK